MAKKTTLADLISNAADARTAREIAETTPWRLSAKGFCVPGPGACMKDAKRLLEILNEPANYGLMPMWRSALRAVPERFKTPIKLRFGYLDDKPQTGEGVLNRLGISLQSFWLAIYLHLVETTPAIFGSYDSEEARISEMSSLREREIAAVEALQSELDILRSLGEGDANQAERLIHAWRNQQNRPKRAA